jgi:hypothetical protein
MAEFGCTIAQLHTELKNTKLRKESKYGWTNDFTNSVVNEYWRFLYLHKCYPDIAIVPGAAIDEVWHDHILHTKSYIAFCAKYFGDYLHHEPKDKSSDEKAPDITNTLALYEATFGHKPPQEIWGNKPIAPPRPTISVVASSSSDCRCR